MNSFELEYVMTETQQVQLEQNDTQTVLRELEPAPVLTPAPEAGLVVERPVDPPESNKPVEMESSPQISSELSYSCLLIPRFSDHYVAGDITRDLVLWMKEICISYGWRLDAITIRPGYLQWVMTVPLTANPAQFMKATRLQTSQKIFEDYPRFKSKNLSSDFWAPGFSVVNGKSPQSAEDINSFILQVRRQQGVY